MHTLFLALESPVIEALGWTLVHFLWQATLLAALLAVLLVPLRKCSARVRYLVQCAMLVAMAACPPVTWFWIESTNNSVEVAAISHEDRPAAVEEPVLSEELVRGPTVTNSFETGELIFVAPAAGIDRELKAPILQPDRLGTPAMDRDVSWNERVRQRVSPALPWLVGAWLLGVVALSLRLLVGWRIVQRLKRHAVTSTAESLQLRLKVLATRMRISCTVTLVESALIEVPTVIGWLRPMILLPMSVLTNLTPQELEAVLAHELAHIRRHDYLVNLIQTSIETLLFYHPAVWWLSGLIRNERELCCDDLAVSYCDNPVTYVTALAVMEELRASPVLTIAANGGSLLRRIRRITLGPGGDSRRSTWLGGSLIALTALAILGMTTIFATHANDDPSPKSEPTADESISHAESVDDRNGVEKAGDPFGNAQQKEKKSSLSVRVVGRIVDAESGAPINNVSWQGGLSAPGSSHTSWGHSFHAGVKLDDGKFEQVINWGVNDRRRVLAAGYEPASLLDELPSPLPHPLVIEKTVRLKKGRVVYGTLRDHLGNPAANARVFFIPKGHRANIVEGIPGVDTFELPNVERRDNSVSEVRTDDNGEFAVPAGAAGVLAASTDLVDLWPFDLPAEDQRAELQMPVPTTLTIDLSQWYLKDVREKVQEALTPGSESPNQCWIWLVRTGSGQPIAYNERMASARIAENRRWEACNYRRTMLVFAPGHDGKLSKGVHGGEVHESHAAELIAGQYRNENIATKIKVALPPGSYQIARLRAGKLIDVSNVVLRAGEEPILNLTRGDGAAVRGTVALPANSVFIRQHGEAPRKLDWTVPTSPSLTITSADGKVREAAHINSDGSFFIATHLEPGRYTVYASAYLPESDQQLGSDGLIFAELQAKQELVIPNVVRDAAGQCFATTARSSPRMKKASSKSRRREAHSSSCTPSSPAITSGPELRWPATS